MMRAMVLDRTGQAEDHLLALREVPASRPGPGQVAIAVEACGVCRTDLHLVEGEVSARLPLIPGHQVAGRVVEVGDGVAGLRKEDLIGVGWLHSTCGECSF
jgi:alcohol dehydrogenase, propanol-preferring